MTAPWLLSLMLAQATAVPVPLSTSKCPFKPAVITKAAQPVMPRDFWKTASSPVTTVLKVTVAADGSVKGATIWKSSGYSAADAEALTAVRLNSYNPTVAHC
jgi:hypothetical protein